MTRCFVSIACAGIALHLAGCSVPTAKERSEPPTKQTPTAGANASTNDPLRFIVSVPTNVRSQPVTGRVLLFLAKSGSGEPRLSGAFSMNPQPVFAIDVTNLAPGAPVAFTPDKFRAPDALAFPGRLDRLEAGAYRAQALIDLDNSTRDFNAGPGNLYSRAVRCELHGSRGGVIELSADHAITNTPPKDTDWVKLVEVRSKLLSEFHGRDTFLRAAVILPSSYSSNAAAKFPALYVIPGFGGRHTGASSWMDSERGRKWKKGEAGSQHLRVFLDPDAPLGHSVFANSANNGPVGDALVGELIPEIERRFRAMPEPRARLLTGHSSGGWSSLWLQVAYADFFGGCWSTAPDPVDFRAFQTMNIYEDRNGHWTREGEPRPVARSREKPLLTIQQLNQLEYVVGYGGQLDSFDAAFSPRGADGRPRQLVGKITGTIDRSVAEDWKKYDIRLQLEQNWPVLAPKLKGKLHVLAAAWDTFYLDSAVELLRDFLAGKDYGGYIEILPGDHGSVLTEAVRERIEREIGMAFAAVRR
ncbi:MAG TPA: alpha/beta hydrolase-fold protein [Verrucomicrobiae bacterium]|nr:alpha/beta hydrolase-fold protein [Verrucomicrobiae bacterium]